MALAVVEVIEEQEEEEEEVVLATRQNGSSENSIKDTCAGFSASSMRLFLRSSDFW